MKPSQLHPSRDNWALDIETLGHLPRFQGKPTTIPAITCACLYNGTTAHALPFYGVSEETLEANKTTLLRLLDDADTLIGFNAILFDLEYIKRYFSLPASQLTRWIAKTVDPYLFMKNQLGITCSLGAMLAMNQLPSKSASGLQAIVWAKQGHMDRVLDYCMMDTKLTYALCCDQPALRINDFWLANWRVTAREVEAFGIKTKIHWSSTRQEPPLASPQPLLLLSTEQLVAEGRVTACPL